MSSRTSRLYITFFYKIGYAKIDQNIKTLQDVNASQISFNYKN